MITEVKKKAMAASREKKLRHFYSLSQAGESVLDVGVSAESKKALPARNYFLKNYRYDASTYTGLGIQDLSGMEDLYPGKSFVRYPGGKFPFSDKQFDWVFSNAVIEHAGDDDGQLLFLNEMMRVAHKVFFTTPNKYFPVESHTNAIFLHWIDNLFYRWCAKKYPSLSRNNLYLFSLRRLRQLLRNSRARSFSIHNNRLAGIPMTFSVTCSDKPSA